MPTGGCIKMTTDEGSGQSIKFRRLLARSTITTPIKLSNVQKNRDHKIKCADTAFLNWESPTAVCGIPAFHLNSNLRLLTRTRTVARIGMNANEVIPFIVRRSFISQNIPAHQIALHQ